MLDQRAVLDSPVPVMPAFPVKWWSLPTNSVIKGTIASHLVSVIEGEVSRPKPASCFKLHTGHGVAKAALEDVCDNNFMLNKMAAL